MDNLTFSSVGKLLFWKSKWIRDSLNPTIFIALFRYDFIAIFSKCIFLFLYCIIKFSARLIAAFLMTFE
jgi:hypothetical protein